MLKGDEEIATKGIAIRKRLKLVHSYSLKNFGANNLVLSQTIYRRKLKYYFGEQ